MKKSVVFLSIAAFILTTGIASADMAFRTQTHAYHPMFGTGYGFNANHNDGAGVQDAAIIQETADEWANEEKAPNVTIKKEPKKESKFVPTTTTVGDGEGYAYQQGEDGYVYGYATGGEQQGVNETKTIYTDGIGRIHFFGKKNRTSN